MSRRSRLLPTAGALRASEGKGLGGRQPLDPVAVGGDPHPAALFSDPLVRLPQAAPPRHLVAQISLSHLRRPRRSWEPQGFHVRSLPRARLSKGCNGSAASTECRGTKSGGQLDFTTIRRPARTFQCKILRPVHNLQSGMRRSSLGQSCGWRQDHRSRITKCASTAIAEH